jgi:uncharacterized protein involved in response to NO
MAQSSAEKMRDWSGPAVLSFGFRPFFLLGALWAALAMMMWIVMLSGGPVLPTRFDPISWHAHEFLFGYLGAIMAGFLLTAVPNWTGRLPVVGWQLGGLVAIWVAGRIVVMTSALMPAVLVAVVDLFFPLVLGAVILREIVAGKNWRNLVVLAMLTVFALANGLFHWNAAQGEVAAHGTGLRLGLAMALMMVSVIGGRVVPSFTRNWLVKAGSDARPAPPMQRFDKATLLVTLAGLLIWVVWPGHPVTGIILLIIAALQTARLIRWKGLHTKAEPLVWVLHAGYAFVPTGALAVGVSILFPQLLGMAAAQHIWMAGAIGLMTLGVMTRATLGHTGQNLHAGPATIGIYLAIIGSVAMGLSASALPDMAMPLYGLSAVFWITAFGGFAVAYGPLLMRPKPARV